jgi:predicted transcriptional regulator of viral defense system
MRRWNKSNAVEVDNRSNMTKILALAQAKGVLRPSDLIALDLPRVYLARLVARGLLVKTGRGLYVSSDAEFTEHHTLAEASRRVPGGVICLLSALAFHQMTSQLPYQVWMAVDKHGSRPKVDQPRLRVVLMSGDSLRSGVHEHTVEGVSMRVFCPAKTVADCFRFRNKIGVDVAIEALREYHRDRRGTMEELMHFARIDRVANVMQPYLESLS